jgi:hypothetical protein
MDLSDVKRKALAYIDEYSTDGVPIPEGENADYLKRMNDFAHDAQTEISDKIGITTSITHDLSTYSNEGNYIKIAIPTDFKEHRYLLLNDEDFYDYQIRNGNIMIPKGVSGTLTHVYYKQPTLVDITTPDTYEFELDLHSQTLIPFYVGGMVIETEKPATSDRLLNVYYSRLNTISKKNDDYISTITVG